MQKGGLYAASAYVLWGVLPLFWKSFHGVPALEILAHRMVWSLGIVLVLLALQGHWKWLPSALRDRRILLTFLTTAVVLSINWFVYIWAVNHGHVLEASLGYFINPLVSVLLGVLFLRERPRLWQTVAIVVALSGVLYLTLTHGSVPWIALALAFSFGIYGLLRKTASLNSLEGLTMETLLLFLPALAYLLWLGINGQGAFGTAGTTTTALLGGCRYPDCPAIAALRGWCATYYSDGAGHPAIHRSYSTVWPGCAVVSRAADGSTFGWLCADLGGVRDLYRREHLSQSSTATTPSRIDPGLTFGPDYSRLRL